MQGWKIFTHSARMIFGNLNAAMRVSLVLYLAQVGAAIYFTSKFGSTLIATQAENGELSFSQGFWPAWVVLMLVTVVTSLWIAVSWHRYVLLEESPGATVPPFKGDLILAYFRSSFLLGFVMLLTALIPMVIASMLIARLVGMGNPSVVALLMLILVGVPTMYVFYRLSLILPAAALGQPKKMGESWEETKPASGAIWQLVAIGLIASMLVELPSYFNTDPTSIVNMVYSYVVGWIVMMVGVSVLTTLYGIYVEGREL